MTYYWTYNTDSDDDTCLCGSTSDLYQARKMAAKTAQQLSTSNHSWYQVELRQLSGSVSGDELTARMLNNDKSLWSASLVEKWQRA